MLYLFLCTGNGQVNMVKVGGALFTDFSTEFSVYIDLGYIRGIDSVVVRIWEYLHVVYS